MAKPTPNRGGRTAREPWERIAALAAEAAEAPMLVGVRPNGTWFAHCGGIEVDSSGPAEAVFDVVREAQRNAESRARQAAVEAKSCEQAAAGFAAAAALIQPADTDGLEPEVPGD